MEILNVVLLLLLVSAISFCLGIVWTRGTIRELRRGFAISRERLIKEREKWFKKSKDLKESFESSSEHCRKLELELLECRTQVSKLQAKNCQLRERLEDDKTIFWDFSRYLKWKNKKHKRSSSR